ncbi:DUF6069 family protein [Cellulomonas sp. URHD0024]|uniref:DUF6069 family protein n=1 Tax=Cellulomonas sp. URHD0024 TaxID=1302620 RepID=UPI000483621A|nr:DUF6069 family protein [Cellulomonas sp. URHD0024]
MSIPNPPPDRHSAYQTGQPAASVPPASAVPPNLAGPAAPQPAVPPPAPQPAPVAMPPAVAPVAVPGPPVPARPASPSVDNARYWAGVAATAVVAALVGLVGVVIVDQILKIELGGAVKDVFGTDSVAAAYAVGGVLSTVVAGALLQLLVMTTPRPRAFFGWIMFLAIVVATLIPLTWTDVTKSAVAAGVINLIVGIAIWSLLSSVLARTLRPGIVIE